MKQRKPVGRGYPKDPGEPPDGPTPVPIRDRLGATEVGLQDKGYAPALARGRRRARRAVCFICENSGADPEESFINPDTFRIRFRLLPGTRAADLRWAHGSCVRGLPEESWPTSVAILRRWVSEAAADDPARGELRRVLTLLQDEAGHAGAA